VWHLADEIDVVEKEVLLPFDVETRVFEDYVDSRLLLPIASNVGPRRFQLKPLAVMHSQFEEVLLLDSDNTPLRDPSYLFNDVRYQRTGSLFWPDYWKVSSSHPIWRLINRTPSDRWEQESGQLLINKRYAWRALHACIHLNSEYYMKLLNGDKDTFQFGWLVTKTAFHMVESRVVPVGMLDDKSAFCGHAMLQHDPDGKALFVHHNQIKDFKSSAGLHFAFVKRVNESMSQFVYPSLQPFIEHVQREKPLFCIDFNDVLSPVLEPNATYLSAELAEFDIKFHVAMDEAYRLLTKQRDRSKNCVGSE
jgi:alpha 1,2-mannosyltransferase